MKKSIVVAVLVLLTLGNMYSIWVQGRVNLLLDTKNLRIATLEGLVVSSDEEVSTCLGELASFKRREANRKQKLKALDEKLVDGVSLVCAAKVLEWTARVEGYAGIDSGMLKQAMEAMHTGKNILTRTQSKRLLEAVDRWAHPGCESGMQKDHP